MKKLRIKPSDVEMEPQSRRMLADFTEDRTNQAVQKLIAGEVDIDVRRLQTALFVSQINAQITDFHKSQLGADLTSSLPHYMWLSLWGLLIGAGITLLIIFSQIKNLLNGLSILFYIFITLEYGLMFAAIKTGQYSEKPQIQEGEDVKVAKGKVCLVIPVGWGIRGLTDSQKESRKQNKISVLTNTLAAAQDIFSPTDIFVFHNSSDQELPDHDIMTCCNERGIYVPIGLGSKSVSAYYGAMLGQWLGYQYVIVMDDDTRLPKELGKVLGQPLDCDAYCMAIAATSNESANDTSSTAKLLIGLQDIEYKLSDLSKLVQYNFTNTSSVLAPHGAINMWRTEILVDIMQEHNCIFHGEDYQMGLIMRNRHKTKRLGIISNCIVNTVAPSTLKELFMQRYTSWDLAAQQFLWGGFCASQRSAHYMQVLFCLPCTIDNLMIRVFTLEDIWTVLQDYLRVILLAYHIVMSIIYGYVNVVVLIMYLVVIGSQWVIAWSLQYMKFKNRKDLQVPADIKLKTVGLFPIYRFAFSFVRVAALLRFFCKFEAVKRNAHPIKQMSLPQPKQLEFAFKGIVKQNEQQSNVDAAMLIKIVQQTLDQARQTVRPAPSLQQMPMLFKNRSQRENSGGGNDKLIPSQNIPKVQFNIEPSSSSRTKQMSK